MKNDRFIPSNYSVDSLDLFGINIRAHGFKNEHHVEYYHNIKIKSLLKTLLGYAEKTNAENISDLRTLYDKVSGFDASYDEPEFEYWNYHRNAAGYTDCMRYKTNDTIQAKIEKFNVSVNMYRFENGTNGNFIGYFAISMSDGKKDIIENAMFRINVYETLSSMFDIVYSGILYKDFDIHNELAVTVVMNV